MRVWLDPIRLAARELTAGDVVNALREQNVNVAAGSVGESPARKGQTYQISVRAAGRLQERGEFENVIVKTARDGTLVRLADIGSVELGAETYSSLLRFQGLDSVGFGVLALPTANALDVQRGVSTEMARLARAFPPGLEYRIAFDTTTVVQESIAEVVETLLIAIALVVLVMFVFLQSWRATLIPALTLPVSLVGAFAFVNLLDFSINTLTLFAVVLATGIVVDDAIVVIENIERHMHELHKSPMQAAFDAMREVSGAVIATALVLIAVFVPVAFFPGTTGRLYQQFALTIAFSVAISAFNAMTLTPALSALLLRHGGLGSGWLFGPIERGIAAGTRVYVRGVRGLVRARWVVALLFVGLLGVTYYVYSRVPRAFVPDEDAGYFLSIVQAPPGASLEYTTRVVADAEKVILAAPEVESVFSILGFSFTGNASNQGIIFTLLKPFEERQRPEQRVQALLPRLRGPLFGIQGGLVVPFAPPGVNIGNVGGFTFEVLDQGGATDIQSLGNAVQALVGASQRSTQVAGLFSSFTANDPQLAVDIDREKAQSLGLPIGEITNALQIYLGSSVRQRLRFQQPRLPRLRAGGQGVPIGPAGSPSVLRADDERADGAARQRGARPRDDCTAGDQPLQPVPVGADQRVGGARGEFGSGAGRDGAARGHCPAGGLRVCLVGPVARRDHGRRTVGRHLRHRDTARLSDARRAVPIAGAPVHRPARRAVGGPRRAIGAMGARAVERPLLPDWTGPADRARGEELHSHRRVRRTAARERPVGDRGGRRSRAHPAAADPDDLAGVHPRRHAARLRHRRRAGGTTLGRHGRRGRHAVRHLPQRPSHSGALCAGQNGDSRTCRADRSVPED